MAILPQGPQAPGGLTVAELVAYMDDIRTKKASEDSGRKTMRPLHGRWNDTYGGIRRRDIDALSGGQRQRACIAMALAQDTQVILLMTQPGHLDMAHQLEVLKLLEKLNKTRGKTIALVIHDLNLAARFLSTG